MSATSTHIVKTAEFAPLAELTSPNKENKGEMVNETRSQREEKKEQRTEPAVPVKPTDWSALNLLAELSDAMGVLEGLWDQMESI